MLCTPDFPTIDDLWHDDGSCSVGIGGTQLGGVRAPVLRLPALLTPSCCEALLAHADLQWQDRPDVVGAQTAGFFSPTLATLLAAKLQHVCAALPDQTYGFGFVRNDGQLRRVNPCFRLTRYSAGCSFGLHRDLPVTFPDGLSDYSLLLHVGGRVDDSVTRFLAGSEAPAEEDDAGMSITDELVAKEHAAVDVVGQPTLLFSQRLIHGGSQAGGADGVKVVLRADVIVPGAWNDDAGSTPAAQTAKDLFRNAQIAELGGGASAAAAEMYERSTHLRLCNATGGVAGRRIAPAALWLANTAMHLVSGPAASACVARSGTRYLFYHGRGMPRTAAQAAERYDALVSAAARYVLATLLQARTPPVVLDNAPLPDEFFMVGVYNDPSTFASDMALGMGDVTFAAAPAGGFDLCGVRWECDLVRACREYERCYCGCDAGGPLPPPKWDKQAVRDQDTQRVVVPPTADVDAPPATVVWDEVTLDPDYCAGRVSFELPNVQTFHHAACTGGWQVVERRIEGVDKRPVTAVFTFKLGPTLLLVKAKVYVVM